MGDNIYLGDRNGVRTPMQWSADRNAGFSRANPQRLYLPVIIDPEYHYETVNVEAQQSNPSSLLWWIKRLITLRKRFRGLRAGIVRAASSRQPQGPGVHPQVRGRADPGRRQPLAVRAVRPARPEGLCGHRSRGGAGPDAFPADHRSALSADARPARLHLVLACRSWRPIRRGRRGRRHRSATMRPRSICPCSRAKRPLARRFRPGHWDELEALLPQYLDAQPAGRPPGANRHRLAIVHAAPIRVGETDVWFLLIRVETRDGMTEDPFAGPDVRCRSEQPMSCWCPGRWPRWPASPVLSRACSATRWPYRTCCRDLLRGILAGRSRRVEDGEIEATPLAWPGRGHRQPG